jgi:hypothetical protein
VTWHFKHHPHQCHYNRYHHDMIEEK